METLSQTNGNTFLLAWSVFSLAIWSGALHATLLKSGMNRVSLLQEAIKRTATSLTFSRTR